MTEQGGSKIIQILWWKKVAYLVNILDTRVLAGFIDYFYYINCQYNRQLLYY